MAEKRDDAQLFYLAEERKCIYMCVCVPRAPNEQVIIHITSRRVD